MVISVSISGLKSKAKGKSRFILPGGWGRLGEYEVRECGRSTVSHPASQGSALTSPFWGLGRSPRSFANVAILISTKVLSESRNTKRPVSLENLIYMLKVIVVTVIVSC